MDTCKKWIISVDLGGTNTKIALFISALTIKAKTSFLTNRFFSQRDKMLCEIVKRSFALLKAHHLERNKIIGLGIGVPGLVDYKKTGEQFVPRTQIKQDSRPLMLAHANPPVPVLKNPA